MTEAEGSISFTELGTSGLKRSGGFLEEEFNTALRGEKARRVYREMQDNEPLLAGAHLAMELLTRRAPWKVKPKAENKSAGAHEVAEWVDGCLHDMEHTWSDLLSFALSAVVYGFAPMERVYKIRRGSSSDPAFASKFSDGRIGWRKFAPRSQDSIYQWEFDDRGRCTALIQMAPPYYGQVRIPMEKVLNFQVRRHKDSPEGRSMYRPIYQPWFFAKRFREIEAIGTERDLAGLPDMQLPLKFFDGSAASTAVRRDWEKKVSLIRNGQYAGIVRPAETDEKGQATGYKFSLVTSGGRRPADVDAIIRRYESRMLMALLAEFILLGMDKVGSFALSSDKTELFALGLAAVLDQVCEVFNRVEIPALCRLNGIPEDLVPELTHGDVERVDISKLSAYVAQLIGVGALVPDEKLEAHLREQGDLPVREEAEAAVEVTPEMRDAMVAAGEADPYAAQQAPTDGAEVAPVAPGSEPQVRSEEVLTGIQIKSAIEIITLVAQRQLPRANGVTMIETFFNLPRETAERLMGTVGTEFFVETPEPGDAGLPTTTPIR